MATIHGNSITSVLLCRFLVQPIEWQAADYRDAEWCLDGKEARDSAEQAGQDVMVWHCPDRKEPYPYIARKGNRWKRVKRLTYRGKSYWKFS